MKVHSDIGGGTSGLNPMTAGYGAEYVYVFPVTSAQRRLLFLHQLDPHSTSYTVAWSIRITGDLDVEALGRSLNEIVRRHEVLRTTYDFVEGEAVQVVPPSSPVPLTFVDLSGSREPELEAQAAAANEAQNPLDLKNGPLVRTKLLRLGDNDHVLLVTTHHIAFDGWSRRILVSELATLYEAFCSGRSSPLSDLPLQYADYAVWQRNFLQGESLEKLVNYWKQNLAGAPNMLDLPTDRPRPAVQSFRGTSKSFVISPELSDRVTQISRQLGVTPFMTLLAAFEVVLSRYSGQQDILVGTPIANRNRPEVEGLIGLFANILPLRVQFGGDPTFRELLERVKDAALGAYAHQDMPFERLVEELRPERSLSYNPLFQVVFSLQNAPRRAFQLSGLELKPLGGVTGTTAKFDLSVFLFDNENDRSGRIEYNTEIFDSETIDRMLRHYMALLESATANPETRVSKLSLLTAEERQKILVDWNATQADYPRDSCLHELIAEQAKCVPDRIATVSGSEQMTYGELHRRSNQLARYLRKYGAGPEVLVGMMVSRTTDLLVAILGVLKAGAAYVPLDPIYPKDRIATILDDTKAPILLTDQILAETLPDSLAKRIYVDNEWSAISQESADDLPRIARSDNLIYVLYTSGSTGKPKGAQIEHRNVVNFLSSMQRKPGLKPEDIWLAVTTLSFDFSVLELYLPLLIGATVVLASREQAANPEELQKLMASTKTTAMSATPATWRMLLESGWGGDPDLLLFCGGEALTPDLANDLLPRCRELWNVYGPTETTVCSNLYRVTSKLTQVAPIGVPNCNVTMHLLDAKGELVPIGVPGELYIGGAGVGRGYQNRPDLTAERFIDNPRNPGERLYRSGDVASYMPDGNLRYHGRTDFQVKIRGFRIELGEIETLLGNHPSIERVVVVLHEDRPGRKRLVAYLVSKPGHDIVPAQLRTYLEASLPDYMVPSIFMKMEVFPINANGKVDRQALPAPDWSQLSTGEKSAPRDNLESILVRIWEKVLGVPGIGVNDNFFDLGGHSVLAVRLLTEVEKVVGRKIPLSSLFRGSTVASLATLLREGSEATPEPLVAELSAGSEGLSPIFAVAAPGVRAIGYALLSRHFNAGQGFYKLQGQGPLVERRPLDTAELHALVKQYVVGMRAVQREGPYYLVAMCGGCQIAEQMVLQLESEGQEVGLLAIVDTWVMENIHRRWGWRLFSYSQRLHWLRSVSFGEKMSWAKRALYNRVQMWTGRIKTSHSWAKAYWPENFEPPQFRAPIVLFKRPRQPYYYIDDPLLGWGKRTKQGVEVHEIDAKHYEFLREPHLNTVSQVLLTHLKPSRVQTASVAPVEVVHTSVNSAPISVESLRPIEPQNQKHSRA